MAVPTAEERYGQDFIRSLASMTYRQTGGWVSFHYIEGFLQCPYYVLHKHLWHGAAEALGAGNRCGWQDAIFGARSADLLGKALHASIGEGPEKAVEAYLKGVSKEAWGRGTTAYQEKLLRRVRSLSDTLAHIEAGGEPAADFSFVFERPGLHVRGQIDEMIGRDDCVDIVEVKCSDNLDFIAHRSMQTHFYKTMLLHLGYHIRDTYYVVYPGWEEPDDSAVIIKNPRRSDWQAQRFWSAASTMMDTPMAEALWPIRKSKKCKTCQFRGKCSSK